MKCERIKIGNIHTNFTKEWLKIGRILTCQNHSLTYATHIFISEVGNQGRARVNKGWVNTGFCLGIHVVLGEPILSQGQSLGHRPHLSAPSKPLVKMTNSEMSTEAQAQPPEGLMTLPGCLG